jgi:hypothetical protein
LDYQSRETIMDDMNHGLAQLMNRYQLDDIGIYEEEGAGKNYYLGYTVRKDGKVFMINIPYEKNEEGELAAQDQEWTIQAETGEKKGYRSLNEVFEEIGEQLH